MEEPYVSVEVRSDAWALARRHEARERDDLILHGFDPLGFVFTRVPGSPWERATVGYTIEVLVDADRTTLAELDLFFDIGLVSLKTLLEDGTIVTTSFVPRTARFDWASDLIFLTRPGAGRYAETFDRWDCADLVWRHHRRVADVSARRRSEPVVCADLSVFFAIDQRGVAIANATTNTLVALLLFVLVPAAGVAAFLAVTRLHPVSIVAVVAVFAMAVRYVPRVAARLTYLRLEPAASMTGAAEVRDKLGDFIVAPDRFDGGAP